MQVLEYVLARMAVVLDQEGRTGYRRCILQFLHDMEKLPKSVRRLMYMNMNSLQAVHIELIHALYASFIPDVHNKPTEQIAINECARNLTLFKVTHIKPNA